MTQQVITAKVRLKPTSKQARQFEQVSEVYRKACNIVSEWYFDNHFNVARKDFNRDMYYVLKNQFPLLNTAMVQSVYRTVKAQYTSQRCVKCGRINKDNRNHDLHLYKCDRCDYSTNDDRIAAMNIQYLGTQYVSGVDNPKFIKIEQ